MFSSIFLILASIFLLKLILIKQKLFSQIKSLMDFLIYNLQNIKTFVFDLQSLTNLCIVLNISKFCISFIINNQMQPSGQGKRQVKQSWQNIGSTLRQTNQEIRQILEKNQKQQKQSRIYDDKRSKERYNSIQEQAILSNKKNTALEMKWSQLKQEEECEKLHHAIQEQIVSYQMIIDGKDRLIKIFQEQLKKKDDDYTKKLKDQGLDIKQMITRMRAQYFTLRDQHLNQLDQIQKKFEIDRKEYIQNSIKKVDDSFQKHVDMEQSFAQSRRKAENQFTKKIQDLRIEGAKHYSQTKIELEKQIQNLQKCHQQMKALYQLNTEKLDYNLKVLKESKEQNNNKLSDLTKKQRNLNDKLRKLKEEFDRADRAFKQTNKTLSQEYKRITQQFKDLQRKFKHFEKADLDKYNEIQTMNEDEVQKLKQKIIKCDITIHMQQLGMKWPGVPTTQDSNSSPQKHGALISKNQGQQGEQTQLIVGQDKLNQVMRILIDEADFIFDDKMRQQLQKATLQQNIDKKLDLLKKTLSVDSIDQLNIFLDQMANRCKWVSEREKQAKLQQELQKQQEAKQQEQRQMKKKRKGGEEKKVEVVEKKEQVIRQEEEKVDLNSDYKVDPTMVVDFLTWWMSTKDERKKLLQRTTKKSLKQLSERQKKQHIAREGKKYWQNLTQVLPERTFRVWKVLDKSLSKYYELLKGRQQLIDETVQLHNQNQELKKLLNKYLQIDHQLQIPPTKLMDKDQTF